ncbi:MAG: ATP-binding cassette domain-containing protein [Erysipelotrichales bacterium]
MILELKGINKEFKIDKSTSFNALSNINLGFNRGEFVSILGPSGCGKSTLLNIIAGLDMPSSGELFIDSKSTKKYKAKNWDFYRKNNIGFVFQQFNLIEHLSALENVELVMSLTGQKKAARNKRALELLESVGISKEHALHTPAQLSGGQKQRVAIARALANDPDIILADEPTGALDTKTGLQVMELLQEVAKDKLIIMVTHNKKLAYDYSSRVIQILDGEIQSDEQLKQQSNINTNKTLNKKNKAMPFREAFKLSLRNMKKKIGRVAITAFAGSVGIAGISLVLGLSNGANIFIDQQITKFATSNVVSVSKLEADPKNKEKVKPVTDKKKYEFVLDNDKVASLRKKVPDNIGNWKYENKVIETQSGALADKDHRQHINDALEGRLPVDGKDEVIVNRAFARSMITNGKEKLTSEDTSKMLNKKVKLDLASSGFDGKQEFKVVGIMDEIDVNQPYIYYSYNDMIDYYKDSKILVKDEQGNKVDPSLIKAMGIKLTSAYDSLMKKPKSYEVVLKDAKDAKEVAGWISHNGKDVQDNSELNVSMMGGQDKVGTNVTSFSLVFQMALSTIVNIAQLVMIAFLIIALVVSSILIAIVLFSSILERKSEIGILKAVGARKKDVMRVFQSEAILLGLFAGLIGIVVSFIIAPLAEMIVNNFVDFDVSGLVKIPLSGQLFGVQVPFLQLISLVLISTLVAFIAGYLPSRRATKMQVIDALRDE